MQPGRKAASAVEYDRIDPRTLGGMLAHSTTIALAVIRAGQIVFANPAFTALFRAAASLTGIALTDIVVDGDSEFLHDAIAAAGSAPVRYFGTGRRGEEPSFDVELCLETAAGEDGSITIAFAWDVTEQHRAREQLTYLAYTDSLTGLANRALFADRLQQAARFARSQGSAFAVLMVDLDGFKAVNDRYGHDAGDAALQLIGQRFQGCLRENDTLARIGGDEFAVLLPRLTNCQVAALVAQRMLAALTAPIALAAYSVKLGASIGIAAWPDHAGSVDALLAAADTAMYRAKRAGKNRLHWATGRTRVDLVSLQPLAWSIAHSVGIKAIDEQHLHMAELIDRLSATLRDGGQVGTGVADLDALIHYTAFHFATEERLMQQHRIDDLVVHRDEHRRLLHDIRNLRTDDDIGSVSLILRFLQEWLLRHVDGMDRRLGEALLAQGCH